MKIIFNTLLFEESFFMSFRRSKATEKSKPGKRFLPRQGEVEMTIASHRPFFNGLIIALIFLFNPNIFCIDKTNTGVNFGVKNHYELLNDFKIQDEPGFFDVDFTPRKTKALIFSTFVPGSGQTFLGNGLKGMAITLSFYGTALAAIIAHNNAQGREDRIKVLTQDYNTKGNYNDAEKVWQTIVEEKGNRDNDYDRRSLFSWLATGVWVYNVFDVIFLTDDQGENEFSLKNPAIDLNLVSFNDFNGVALKLNLP